MAKWLVEKHITQDYSIEVDADSEEEAHEKAGKIRVEDWTEDGGDTWHEVNEIE